MTTEQPPITEEQIAAFLRHAARAAGCRVLEARVDVRFDTASFCAVRDESPSDVSVGISETIAGAVAKLPTADAKRAKAEQEIAEAEAKVAALRANLNSLST